MCLKSTVKQNVSFSRAQCLSFISYNLKFTKVQNVPMEGIWVGFGWQGRKNMHILSVDIELLSFAPKPILPIIKALYKI